MTDLFERQLGKLRENHFLILYWAAKAEEKGVKYNITNVFDDLKFSGSTRTKQSAVAVIEALSVLCFLDISGDGNRKHIYITTFGAKALEVLLSTSKFKIKKSIFLEGHK